MPRIVIPLDQIIIDPERRVDLTTMAPDEAVRRIKESYSFLSSMVDVELKDGIVTISLSESEATDLTHEAQKLYSAAVNAANKGEYRRAIDLFQKVLKIAPSHVDARRNMAMAYLESGAHDLALDHLIDVLRQDPRNTWALVLVANIFNKNKNSPRTAEVYYKAAIDANPLDSYALGNYGALLAKTNRLEEAVSLFQRAIAADPDYPSWYLGVAMVLEQQGDLHKVVAVLDDLFSRPSSSDRRSQPVYTEARRLYEKANLSLAERSFLNEMAFVNRRRREIASATGTAIELYEDPKLETVDATCELAWNHGRNEHRIRYRPAGTAIIPHLIAHEMEHIRLEDEAYRVGLSRSFARTPKSEGFVRASLSGFIAKAKKSNQLGSHLETFLSSIIHGLSSQLFNCPVDMLVEYRLFDQCPELRPSQFASLRTNQARSAAVLKDRRIASITPPVIYQSNVEMNCAYALFTDWLYKSKTDYALAYKAEAGYSAGKRLLGVFLAGLPKLKAGDEYDLVDEFASVLGLRRWYEWMAPRATSGVEEVVREVRSGGSTNPKLLAEKSPASVMYCLAAMELFDTISAEKMRMVVAEIAMIGRGGLDYTSSDKKYCLASLPGRRFSGLEMMCMMHVGLKRVDPTVDSHTGLDEEYRQALTLYAQRREY